MHEWSHLRYGVFDEYPLASEEQFYLNDNNVYEGIRCSKEIKGEFISIFNNSI